MQKNNKKVGEITYLVLTNDSDLSAILAIEQFDGHEESDVLKVSDEFIIEPNEGVNLVETLMSSAEDKGMGAVVYDSWESLSNSEIFEVEEFCAIENGTPYGHLGLTEEEIE